MTTVDIPIQPGAGVPIIGARLDLIVRMDSGAGIGLVDVKHSYAGAKSANWLAVFIVPEGTKCMHGFEMGQLLHTFSQN